MCEREIKCKAGSTKRASVSAFGLVGVENEFIWRLAAQSTTKCAIPRLKRHDRLIKAKITAVRFSAPSASVIRPRAHGAANITAVKLSHFLCLRKAARRSHLRTSRGVGAPRWFDLEKHTVCVRSLPNEKTRY